jgi:type 1 glutamine amidotransferase
VPKKIISLIPHKHPFRYTRNTTRVVLQTFIIFLLTLVSSPCFAAKTSVPDSPVKVLIVDGFNNHDWQHTTRLIRGILEETGRFDIDVATCPAKPADPGFATFRPQFDKYDVIIQNCNNLGNGGQWPEAVRQDFLKYIRKGGGVYIFHSANNSFSDWVDYNRIIGLGWRDTKFPSITIGSDVTVQRIPAGEGKSTSHGPRTDRLVHRLNHHPIHAGLPMSWMAAMIEVYTFPRGPAKKLDVLSWAEDPGTKTRWPIEWTVSFGKGCVYNSTLGHVWANEVNPSGMRCAGFQTLMVRALQWLAKRPVDFPVPNDFPGETAAVLRTLPGESIADFSNPFNGKDLTGWGYLTGNKDDIIFESFDGKNVSSDGRYTGKEGILAINPWDEAKGPHWINLWTKQEYSGDFSLTLEFRASVNADSGIFLRGKQLQCRDYLVAGPYKELKKYKAQDWNKIEVVVKDNIARCTCNGEILEAAFKLPVSGRFGIEADRGLMEYRNIRINAQ